MSTKILWKVPASALLLVLIAVALLLLLPVATMLTFVWLPFALGGATQNPDPPVFWLFDGIQSVLDWWEQV